MNIFNKLLTDMAGGDDEHPADCEGERDEDHGRLAAERIHEKAGAQGTDQGTQCQQGGHPCPVFGTHPQVISFKVGTVLQLRRHRRRPAETQAERQRS